MRKKQAEINNIFTDMDGRNTLKALKKKIDLYIDGELTSEQIDELWAELLQDENGFEYLKTAANFKQLTRESSKPARRKEKFFNLPVASYWSAAAAILFIIGSLAVFKSLNESAVPLQPIAAIELDYYRSAGGAGGVDENLDLLWYAMTMANLGEGNEAVKMLDDRAEQLEDGDLKLEFLITVGSIYYNMDQFEQAADRFESAQKIDTGDMAFMERNYWYLGNTYLRLNRHADARTILEKTVNMNGAYSRVAEAYLNDLEE